MRESRARATLLCAVIFSSITIWAVHYQQNQEREVWISYTEIYWLTWTFRTCTRVFFVMMSAGDRRCCKDRLNWRNLGEKERDMREFRPSTSQTMVIKKCANSAGSVIPLDILPGSTSVFNFGSFIRMFMLCTGLIKYPNCTISKILIKLNSAFLAFIL